MARRNRCARMPPKVAISRIAAPTSRRLNRDELRRIEHVRNVTRLLVLALAVSPASLLAQKKDDLTSIQRDVAQLEDQVRQLQKSQDEKNAALTALVQQ